MLQIGDDGSGQRQVSASATSTCTCPSARRAAATAPSWCDVGALDRRDAYLEALLGRAASGRRGASGALDTVYLGGGTPDADAPAPPARACWTRSGPRLADGAEVSIEANPETVDRRALAELRAMGVNRLSLGVQSFQPHLLARARPRRDAPTRRATPSSCARAAGLRRTSASTSSSAIPGQTPGRPRGRPRRRPRARAGPRLLVRARAQAGHRRSRAGGHAVLRRGRGRRRLPAHRRRAWRTPATAGTRRPTSPAPATSAATAWPTGARADYLGVGVGAVSTVGGPALAQRARPGRLHRAPLARGGAAAAHPRAARRRRRAPRALDAGAAPRPRAATLAWAGPPDHPEALERLSARGPAARATAARSRSPARGASCRTPSCTS